MLTGRATGYNAHRSGSASLVGCAAQFPAASGLPICTLYASDKQRARISDVLRTAFLTMFANKQPAFQKMTIIFKAKMPES
jgi:hypothetical protein